MNRAVISGVLLGVWAPRELFGWTCHDARVPSRVAATAIKASRSDDLHESEVDPYAPPEWNNLPPEARAKLAQMLSWDNLSSVAFDVVEVAAWTRDPLLLVG